MSTEIYLGLIIVVIVLICIVLIKILLKRSNILHTFTKKDMLVFSVLALYFLPVYLSNVHFPFDKLNNNLCDHYNVEVYYNPHQEELWPGQFEEARRTNAQIKKSCSFHSLLSSVPFLIIWFASIIIFIPIAIIIFTELLLLILAIIDSKNVFLIKRILRFDLFAKEIIFKLRYWSYPIDKKKYFDPLSVEGLNREYKKTKEIINKYYQLIGSVTKENTSFLYEKVEAMFILLIISFYVLNIVFIGYDFVKIINTDNVLSLSLLVGLIIFAIAVSKVLVFLFNYKKEHAIEFFQQRSHGDKLFLICIIFVILTNHLFLLLSFVELFGILYIMSYLFDLIYNKIIMSDKLGS